MSHGLDLCEICRALLPENAESGSGFPTIFSRALVPFLYAYPVDRFVRSLKFRNERSYARVLGMLLAQEHLRSGAALPQALIPVPLHTVRYRARGFNQAAEIARYAANALGLSVDTGCLERVVNTQEQSGLALAARKRNVRGAFRMRRPPGRRHIALVDDVLTTGNTAAEAAGQLLPVVERVELWAAAVVRLHAPGEAPGTQ